MYTDYVIITRYGFQAFNENLHVSFARRFVQIEVGSGAADLEAAIGERFVHRVLGQRVVHRFRHFHSVSIYKKERDSGFSIQISLF